jgi:ribosome biogenesis GTPase
LPEGTRRALVVSVGRNAAWLALDGEASFRVAHLRKKNERLALSPGDRVLARVLSDDKAIVDEQLARTSTIVRETAGGRTKTMAANVDAMVIVSALENPPPSLTMIDELVAFAELNSVRAVLVLTKPDLASPAKRAEIEDLYRGLGYAAFTVSPKFGDHMPELAADLAERHALLIGQSGVGKSSIYRALGGLGTTIGDLSKAGRGKQTTTSARLHRFAHGFLIDSPGIGEFELRGIPARELGEGFVEFREPASRCRFADCKHLGEPDCGVRTAAGEGKVAPSRYASYRAILERG